MNKKFTDILKKYPIAHRGYFDNLGPFPENSCGAILEAVRLGFAVEFDVMLSADEEVVVFHDDSLERMCNLPKAVHSLDASELSSLFLMKTQERIPMLSHILELVAGQRPLVIELKSFSREGLHTNGRLEGKVVELLRNYSGPVALKSFNPFTVNELLRIRPYPESWPVGFISCDYSKDEDFGFMTSEQKQKYSQIVEGVAPACDFVSYNINDLSPTLSSKIRSRMPLMVWTIRTEAQFLKASQLADNIVFEWRGVQIP